jgi:hypothetical protein
MKTKLKLKSKSKIKSKISYICKKTINNKKQNKKYFSLIIKS